MKKLFSLMKACMTSDMNIFKIKQRKDGKNNTKLIIFIVFIFMFSIWSNANILFEKMAPLHLQFVVLSLFVFGISYLTFMEGIYKSGPIMFNCKDDQLLLSLPIERKTVLFIRIFKFYLFELLFNSLFMIPFMIAYIRWADTLNWTFFLTSIVMLIMLPIIPIVLSCVVGAITSSITSRFKYKNFVQITLSMIFCLGIMYVSYNLDSVYNYLVQHATSINDFIRKIYYPAGVYADLVLKFDILELLTFVLINITLFIITIFILSKFYFKINSRLKKVTTSSNVSLDHLKYKNHSVTHSLIWKELGTFFKTPVFIMNAGFGLVLFLFAVIYICLKFDSLLLGLTDPNGMNFSKDVIMGNLSVFMFSLISIFSYMTSITNSVISLEGRNINILKSLPINIKTILMSKIYACLWITTPVFLIGSFVLFIRFHISLLDSIFLIVLSVLIPLVSHFMGLLVNLKYPKLDAENSAEVVKQSMSSFIAVMMGMLLAFLTFFIVFSVVGKINATLFLGIAVGIYLIIDFILYELLIHWGIQAFRKLTV